VDTSHIVNSHYDITFLTKVTNEEIVKVVALIDNANNIIDKYFGVRTSFDIVICRGGWEMEIQFISRRLESPLKLYDDTKSVALTDYRLKEIIIGFDLAKFGHYLHELLHGIINIEYTQQLREGLAWHFTMKLTESYRYVRPSYPSWVDNLYLYPVNKLAQIVGNNFLKDFAVGKASIQEDALPSDIQGLFQTEEIFYSKKRSYH
jgi:hypothetical protein